jgi:hypothetical protein
MKIYDQEKNDGLEEILKSSASISYACVVEPYVGYKKDSKYLKSIASFNDEDLYYVQSILVSSSWNKNDDIFDKVEVWNAKNTPEHKPTNLEHDEHSIIGHIVSNWPITEDGILIDENTPIENLPEKYHILTGSVIYKGFSSDDLRERSLKLISEIEDGIKYVSMECFFKGFDYGLLNKNTGEYKILGRNSETAYLTKFLRSYGGIGEHQDYKVGRVLRNITFSGKGFVNKPANEDSIIFSKNLISPNNNLVINDNNKEKNQEIVNSGVLNIQSNIQSETLIMSSANTEINTENKEVPVVAEVAAEQAEQVEQTEVVQVAEVNAAELTSKIEELTVANETLKAEIEQIKSEAAKKTEEQMKKEEEMMKKAKSELEAALTTIAEYVAKEEAMMKKEKKMKRMATLIEAGIDNESAEATVDKFESLDDEAFEAMTSLFAGKLPPWLEKIKKKDKEEEAMMTPMRKMASEQTSIEADPSVLETAEVEANINLGVGSNDVESALESTRAALVDFVCSTLGKKNSK